MEKKTTTNTTSNAKNKKRINWEYLKERVLSAITFILFTCVMTMGFWVIYRMLWFALGFNVNNIALGLLFIQAIISEQLFVKLLDK